MRNSLKPFLTFLMLASFLVLAVTGIVRVPEIQRYFIFVYDYISPSRLAFIHDWSGVVTVILIFVHLFFERRWFIARLKNRSEVFKGKIKLGYLITIALLILVGVYFIGNRKDEVKNLSGVEINEYQGEKLGSINDFRENSIKGVQRIGKESYQLEIGGSVEESKNLSYSQILELPTYQKVVQLNCVEGWSVKGLWKGVLVKDLLKDLEINPEAKTIIFYAADGYLTSFPLNYILEKDILMAYNLNDVELPAERGFPFQLVAQQKWGYKWVKWITKIELSDDENYKGFWESRGYNNNGDFSGPKFEK